MATLFPTIVYQSPTGLPESSRTTMRLMLLGIATYTALAILPPLLSSASVSDLYDMAISGETSAGPLPMIGLGVLLACLSISLALNARVVVTRHSSECIFLGVFCLASMLLSLVNTNDFFLQKSFSLVSTVYVYITLFVIWNLQTQHRRMIFLSLGVSLLVVLTVGWLLKGTGAQRWVGALNPNHFARYAVCALFFVALARRQWVLPALALTLLLCIVVSSRTAIVGALLFFVFYFFLTPTRERPHLSLLFGAAAIIIGLDLDHAFNRPSILSEMSDRLALFSSDRGLDSGLSGRAETYGTFLNQDVDGFIYGWGFRFTKYYGLPLHSGILKILFEFGVVLGTLILLAILLKLFSLMRLSLTTGTNRARACAAFIAASLAMTFSEPDSINVGYFGSFCYLLALSSPGWLLREDYEELAARRE